MYPIINKNFHCSNNAIDFKTFKSMDDPKNKVLFALYFSNAILDHIAENIRLEVQLMESFHPMPFLVSCSNSFKRFTAS